VYDFALYLPHAAIIFPMESIFVRFFVSHITRDVCSPLLPCSIFRSAMTYVIGSRGLYNDCIDIDKKIGERVQMFG
jgi:hypothetical protein